MNETGPSERAVDAAAKTFNEHRLRYAGGTFRSLAEPALIAAHDPKLGLDRSVCLRDVLEAVRGRADEIEDEDDMAAFMARETAIFIEQAFTEEAGSDG